MTSIHGAKGGGDSQRAPIEAKDSLRSAATARIIDLIGEGPIVGLVHGHKSVFLEDTPLQNEDLTYNFQGVEVHERFGTPDQSHIAGFSGVEAEFDVSTQIKVTQPVVRRITGQGVDAVRIKIRLPSLSKTNSSTGDVNGTSVTVAVDIQEDGGDWQLAKEVTIKGKTSSAYERQVRVELPGAGPWNVRLRRITADSEKQTLQNQTYWATYTEIIDAKLSYPDSALIGIVIDARQFGNTVPSRSYDVKGRIISVPSNYDPDTRAYTGVWDGTFKQAWTDNPAWIFYDLATNTRYGAGIGDVDKWSLYQIGQYCDELVPDGYGGLEPRFTANTVLADQTEAVSALSQLVSVFRGMVYWGTNTAVAVADLPTDPVKLVTPANVIDGEFEYSGTSLRDRHTVVAVTWNDPSDGYKQQVELVEDSEGIAKYGWRQIDITAVACTSRGQARRLGLWALYSERHETETVTYRASLDHMDIRPGDVVAISDPATIGARYGGRLAVVGTEVVTLDAAPVSMPEDQNWFLDVLMPSGTIERRPVETIDGAVVTLAEPLSEEPLTAAMWVLSSQAVKPSLYRISSATEEGDVYRVTAAAYDPRKYDAVERGLGLFDPPVYRLGAIPKQVTGLTATDHPYRSGSGISTNLAISWDRSDDAALTWRIRIRNADDGNWQVYNSLATSSLDIPNVTDGATYIIECYGVNSVGQESPVAGVLTYTVLGKSLPPADVTGFRSAPEGSSLKFRWDHVPDVDLHGYEVRYDDTGWGGADPDLIAYRGPNNSFTADQNSLAYADPTLYARAVDTSGNYSENSAQLNVVVSKPATPVVSVSYQGSSARLSWVTPSAEFQVSQYRVIVTKPGSSPYTVTQGGTVFDLPLDFLGAATVSVAAVDAFGTPSNSATVSVTCLSPVAPSGVQFFPAEIGVLGMRWSPNGQTTLPVAGYEVRLTDSNWGEAGALHRGAVSTCYLTDFHIGTNTYYIRTYDAEGHYSASSVVAVFEYAGPVLPGVVRYGFTSAAYSGLIPIRWPELNSLFGTDRYEVTLTRPGVEEPERFVTRGTEWLAHLDWVGMATVAVVGYDNSGAASPAITANILREAPATPGPTDLKLISYSKKAMTVEISWPSDSAMTTLPIAGFELRLSDSGWGGSGHLYRGSDSRTTLADIRPDENLIYYLKAYDVAGAYSTDAYAVNILKNVGPEPVTQLTATPKGQYLRLKWKASVSTKGEVRYEVRTVDDNWGEVDDTRVYYGSATHCDIRLDTPGSYTFYVRALDKFWEYSFPVTITYDYMLGEVENFFYAINLLEKEPFITLLWDPATPDFGVNDYILETPDQTLYLKATWINIPPAWVGDRDFSISVRDMNMNVSNPVTITVTVNPPVITGSVPSIVVGAASKNKGNLTLSWTDGVKGTLPIAGYEVRESDTDWGRGSALYEGAATKAVLPAVPMDQTTTWYLRAFDTAKNYSTSSKLIVNNGMTAPAAVTGTAITYNSTSAATLSWDRSPEPDVVEYEVRTSNSGWGSVGHVYRGAQPTCSIAKPPSPGVTYYITALDTYGQRSVATPLVFTYPTPAAPADSTYAFGGAAGNVLIDWPDTNPLLGLKHYKVTYEHNGAPKTVTSKASSVTFNPTWVGSRPVQIQAVDSHGIESPAATLNVPVAVPGNIGALNLTVTSIKAGAQVVLLDWPDAEPGSFKVVGYEIRKTDSGWGSSGHVYRGAASQASLKNVSTTAPTTWYVRAYDPRGNYSAVSATMTYVTALPFQVTSVKVKRVGSNLELSCKTPAKGDNFSHIEYRVGKVMPAATTGDDEGINEGVVGSSGVDIWSDPDVFVATSPGTSDDAVLSLLEFPAPRMSKSGITYRVAARVVDKNGNVSPASAQTSLSIKSLT